jgi:hypothetical protein
MPLTRTAIVLEGADDPAVTTVLDRLAADDVLGQLLRREGRMAELATEAGDIKLDWVDGVEKALKHPEQLEAVEEESRQLVAQGIRHVIWSGMGGSVQTVYTLKRMGYLDRPELSIHPLDSTDPATLNRILAEIGAPEGHGLRQALAQTAMIGVSMGMTSEEPITHLDWFDGLLREHAIADPGSHIQVMTLPGSYLDQFARARGSPMVPIQLDGENHTPGRMSAPATRVFLRPVALMLAAAGLRGGLRAVLERGQALYRLSHTMSAEARAAATRDDPFLRLAAWLSLRAGRHETAGAPKLLLSLPPAWLGFAPWLEQLVEESLGKGGKGFLIFYGQSPEATYGRDCAVLRFELEGRPAPPGPRGLDVLTLRVPSERLEALPDDFQGLGELAGLFLGFKKTVAAYGYLQEIVFDYSSLPRRSLLDEETLGWHVAQLGGERGRAADVFAGILHAAREAGSLRYLDLTWNGEPAEPVRRVLQLARERLANGALGIPCKVRTGPSDYHSTEQSETDGPPELVSLRLVAQMHEPVAAGSYDDKFLLAQARGTWQAMQDAGRWIVFLALPDAGTVALISLERFFERAAALLSREAHSQTG